MADVIREAAPAKVNPFLRVLGRREDGFHEIETLVLPITLADGVEVRRAAGLSLRVVGPRAPQTPAGEENLVLRAARALGEAAGGRRGAAMLLAKQVPVAAGLGGGSADAAAALRALNDLWELRWSSERLSQVGEQVGSDVPALLHRAPVMARGRGERIERVSAPKTWWVLLTQAFGVAAADAYAWWEPHDPGSDVRGSIESSALGDGSWLRNDLARGVVARHPEVGEAMERALAAGALGAVVSGSGPTVAALCRDGLHAEQIAQGIGGMAVASLAA